MKESNVEIDACPLHGTWFDAGELAVLARHFQAKAVRPDQVGAFSQHAQGLQPHPRTGLLDLVIALVELAHEKLSEKKDPKD